MVHVIESIDWGHLPVTGKRYMNNYCYISFSLTSTDVPGPPGIPDISDIDKTCMTLTWTPPTDDGGAKILGYIVEKCDADRKRWTKAHKEDLVTELTLTLHDLMEGTNYMFRVSAENAAGVGESSPATQPKKAKPPYGKHNID